ncbi:MAG: hypothetical protein JXB07_10680 [Anaerolineae bacterium]|nr:hypothetical protein [Anaerolineae bacterium]
MNKTAFSVALLIAFNCLTACSQTAHLPTPTKTPVSFATSAPVSEPVEALPVATVDPARIDLSGVTLTSADLPAGFQAASPETMGPIAEGFTQAPFFDVTGASGFTLAHPEGPELIVTFSGIFAEDDPFREDAPATQKPLFAMYMFIVGAGTQEIAGDGLLEGLEGIGEEAQGYFGLTNLNTKPIRVDLVVFHRGRAGVYVFHLYPRDQTTTISAITLAQILDARLSTTINSR